LRIADADADTVAIIAEGGRGRAHPLRGLIHCFSTTRDLSGPAIDLGSRFAFRHRDLPKSTDLQEIARELPEERLLVETDSPYLAPMPMRGRKNEPSFVVHTADFLAQLRNTPRERLDRVTTDNFFRLFTKAARPVA
jgi:TatD DNase family protein